MKQRLRRIQHVALDMDGTIYRGGTVFEFTNPFLSLLSDLGISYSFLTNNSSKSVKDYVAHLGRMGINASQNQIFTSTQATLEFLKEQMPDVRRVFILGTTSMIEEIAASGLTPTSDSADDVPDAVIVGFDSQMTYARLCRAAWWISQGKPFIASHPDRICPTDEPLVLVDCGSICAALKAATGREPDAILGKPDPRMLRGLLQRYELRPENLAMVGDRLYTDLAMAHRAGAMGVLVLTGEATAEQAESCQPRPDLVVANIAEFGKKLQAVREEKNS